MMTDNDSNNQKTSLLERIGLGFLAGILMELAFWIFLGLITLAFTGGVWGLVTALALGALLAVVLRDFYNMKKLSQSRERNE